MLGAGVELGAVNEGGEERRGEIRSSRVGY